MSDDLIPALNEILRRAQQMDLDNRPPGSWSRVPSDQVLRFICAALTAPDDLQARARAEIYVEMARRHRGDVATNWATASLPEVTYRGSVYDNLPEPSWEQVEQRHPKRKETDR